jgi:hypothetical protein
MAAIAVFGNSAGLGAIRPGAVVILGGLVTATLYVLFVVPTLYQRFGSPGTTDPIHSTVSSGRPDGSGFPAKAGAR